LGKRGERRRWREERPERSAAVYIFKAASTAAENIGHRKPGCRTDEGNLPNFTVWIGNERILLNNIAAFDKIKK